MEREKPGGDNGLTVSDLAKSTLLIRAANKARRPIIASRPLLLTFRLLVEAINDKHQPLADTASGFYHLGIELLT
ncbi:Sensor protein EvgS [Trichinella spiralis]|uniref:Sensor protein EvgS n=1 Tax=Trichinella spiralis TaxID=6334 RepID=A0ABR3KNX3_TRISP